jgi:hypothetical protein
VFHRYRTPCCTLGSMETSGRNPGQYNLSVSTSRTVHFTVSRRSTGPASHELPVDSYREPIPAAVQQQSRHHNRHFHNQSMSTSSTAVYPATSSPPQNVRQYRQHVTFLSSRAESISRRLPAVAVGQRSLSTYTGHAICVHKYLDCRTRHDL